MPMIDPNDPKQAPGEGGKLPKPRPGERIAATVGFERYSAQTGTPMIMFRFLIVEGGPTREDSDVGRHVNEDYPNTAAAAFRLNSWAAAHGQKTAWDTDNDETITTIMRQAYVKIRIVNGERGIEVNKISAYDGEIDPAWEGIAQEGEKEFEKYLEWSRKNPRGSEGRKGKGKGKSSGSGGSGGGRGGGWSARGSGGSSGATSGGDGGGSSPGADIPF